MFVPLIIKDCKLLRFPSSIGISPFKGLSLRNKYSKFDKFPSSEGIAPVMDVPLIVKDCKLVRFPIHTGIEPMKFPPSSKDSKSLKNSIFEGIVEPSPFNDI